MNIKLNLNAQDSKRKSSKTRSTKAIFSSLIKAFNIRLKIFLSLVAFLTCLALSASIFISLPNANSLTNIPTAKTEVNTDLSSAQTGQTYTEKNSSTAEKKSENSDQSAGNSQSADATSSAKTGLNSSSDKTPKPKNPNLKTDSTPTLTSLNLTLEDNKDIDIKWSGLAFKDNADIVSFSLDLNSHLQDSVHHIISFAPADSLQNTNTDPTIAVVCGADSTNPELDTCEFVIKADGSNLDDSSDLSTPSPRATFKALPRRSYEANFLVRLNSTQNQTAQNQTAQNQAGILLNNTIPAYINYTPPTADTPPVFSDIAKLPQARQDAINAIAAINITSGSDCKVGAIIKKCYAPVNTVNRGAMAEFMRSTLGKPDTTKPDKNIADNADSDTNIGLNTGRRDAIKWLAAEEVTSGTQKGSYKYKKTTYKCTAASFCYKPWDSVSRGVMAEFLWNLAGKPSVTQAQINKGKSILTGNDYTISGNENRTNAILWMAANGITTGSTCQGGKTCYAPKNLVNRGAMAEFLNKFYNMIHYNNPYGKMLKTQNHTTTFLGTTYLRANIKTITFTKNPASPIGTTGQTVCKDVSDDGLESVGTISACSDNDGQDIILSSKGGVVANINSSYLFYGLSSLTAINGFVNSSGSPDAFIGTDKITQMHFMFENTKLPDNLTFPAGFGSAAKNMYAMFEGATLPVHLTTFPDGFGKIATDMSYMFSGVVFLTNFTSLPVGFGSSATDMSYMFAGSTLSPNFTSFPPSFAGKAVRAESMFENVTLKASINWLGTATLKNNLDIDGIWNGTNFGSDDAPYPYKIHVANTAIQAKLLNTTVPILAGTTFGNGNAENIILPDYIDLAGGRSQGSDPDQYLYKCYENSTGSSCSPTDTDNTGKVHYYYNWQQAMAQVPYGFYLPTKYQMQDLIDNQLTYVDSFKNWKTWNKFGYFTGDMMSSLGEYGFYWSSTGNNDLSAYEFYFNNSNAWCAADNKHFGLSVRYFKATDYIDLEGGRSQGNDFDQYLYRCYENANKTDCTPNDEDNTGLVHYYYTYDQAKARVPAGFYLPDQAQMGEIEARPPEYQDTFKDYQTWGKYGYFDGRIISEFNEYGFYWSFSQYNYLLAYCLFFGPLGHFVNETNKEYGLSVRYFKIP